MNRLKSARYSTVAVCTAVVVFGAIVTGAQQAGIGGAAPSALARDHVRAIAERLGVPRTLNLGPQPARSFAVADFDGDGDADIAVGATNARDVFILLGDAFQPFGATAVASRSDWPVVEAFTNVAGVAYRTESSPLFSTTSLSPRAAHARGPGGLLVAADADGDGSIDLIEGPSGATALTSGDLDGDGAIDLVGADGLSTSVTLMFGDGRGGFSRTHAVDVGCQVAPHGLVVTDVDRDGSADLVVLADESNTVSVMRGDGSGSLFPYARAAIDTDIASSTAELAETTDSTYEGITSLTLNPATIAGGSGATSTGTVTLNAPAPAGGVAVTLGSSNTDLAASTSSITVPEGATTATFIVGTNKDYRRYSALGFNVTISATHGSTTRTATLAVTAQPRPGTLSSFDAHNSGDMCFGVGVRRTTSGYELEFGSAGNLFTCVPPDDPVGQDGTCTFKQECALGCELRAPENGSRFRDVCATTAPFPVAVNPRLVVGGDPTVATLNLNAAAPVSSSGVLSSMTVLANTNPNISTPIPAGATSAQAQVLTSRVNTPQFAPIDGSYYTPRSDGSRAGRIGLAWLALTPGNAPPFRLTSFTFDPNTLTSVVGGAAFVAIGQMNQVAPAPEIATASMTVTSSHPSVASAQSPVTFTHGSSSRAFFIQTQAVAADTVVTFTATLGDTTLTRQITVRATPGATRVNSFFLNPFDVVGGNPATGTVVLNGAASGSGAVVSLVSSNSAVASMPASVTVPAGSDRTSFTISTSPVSSNTTVTLTASYNGTWAATSLIVTPGSSPPPPPPPQTATLTVTATGRSGERVVSSPTGINVTVGSTGSASFATGTSIRLSVASGREAVWSGACSSGGNRRRTCTFTLNGNASVTANVR